MVNAEKLYASLRVVAEEFGFVSEEADDRLAEATEIIANDPRSEEN